MFSILIEPTTEKYQVPVNGQLIPCRIWRGTTPSGIEVEAYVVSIVPMHEHDTAHLAAELPAMMRPSREVYDIDVGGETREVLRAVGGRLYQVTLHGQTVEELDRQEENWLTVVLPRMVERDQR